MRVKKWKFENAKNTLSMLLYSKLSFNLPCFYMNSPLLIILGDACWGIRAALSNCLRQKPEWTLFFEVSVSGGDSSLSSVLFELCSDFLAGPLAISRSGVLWRPERTGGSWCMGLLEIWSMPSTSPKRTDSFKCARGFLFEDTWNDFRPLLLFFPQNSLTGRDQANHSNFYSCLLILKTVYTLLMFSVVTC